MNGRLRWGAGGWGQLGVPRQACSGRGSVGPRWGVGGGSGVACDLLPEDDDFGVIVEEEVWGVGERK